MFELLGEGPLKVCGSFGVAILAVILNGALARTTSDLGSRATAYDQSFWWAIGFTGLAVLVSFALPGRARPAVREPEATPAATTRAGKSVSQ